MTPTLSNSSDTIAALATASGRGGIAVIRVSGKDVKKIMQGILDKQLTPRNATHTNFLDEDTKTVDMGIALFFENPHSFTGEDVLELHCHGGPIVIDLILQRLLSLGARLARPGEFSERAFLNGKIDLAQAEGIADLIDATSKEAARSAIRSLQGEFSQAIHAIKEKIIAVRLFIEAAIDFTDEEIDFLKQDKIIEKLQTIIEDLKLIQNKSQQGNLLREGISVVIAGKPNVGKSSLLNCLSEKEVAIVTNIPGTTRDVLRNQILIDGLPLHIIDTAGLRESNDVVEQEGIRRAQTEIENADIILYLVDVTQDENFSEEYSNPKTIFVRNKIDLLDTMPQSSLDAMGRKIISLSVKSKQGIELLKKAIKEKAGYFTNTEGIFLARRRHLDALEKTLQHINAGLNQLQTSHASELAAEDLRLAQQNLSEITGEFSADDLLGRIFSSFCIGK